MRPVPITTITIEGSRRLFRFPAKKLLPASAGNCSIHLPASRPRSELKMLICDPNKLVSRRQIEKQFLLSSLAEELDYFPGIRKDYRYLAPRLYYDGARLNGEVFCGGLIEVARPLRGQGWGSAFLSGLRSVLKDAGFKFYGGVHNTLGIARFFVKRGRRFIEELDPACLEQFNILLEEAPDPGVYFTLAFLDPLAEPRYVVPELLDAPLEHRLKHVKARRRGKGVRGPFDNLVSTMRLSLRHAELRTTVCEILEDFQQRGIPLTADFYNIDHESRGGKTHLERQISILVRNRAAVRAVYSDVELAELLGYLEE